MRRRDSAMPSPSVAIGERVRDVVEIVERLAHAHHHDVGDEPALAGASRLSACGVGEIAEPVARHQELADDLLGRQVAHELLRAGVAEACR